MKTLQPITTILLTLALLIVGSLGLASQAYACECEFALYTDQRAAGTDGDPLAANTWNVRDINTEVINEGGSISVDLDENEITLDEGRYYIHVTSAVKYGVYTKLRLRTTNQTPNKTLAVGHAYHFSNIWMGNENQLLTYVEITTEMGDTTFHIEHFVTGSIAIGGEAVNDGEPEMYLTIRIVKVTADGCH